jgi:hypothetical protein
MSSVPWLAFPGGGVINYIVTHGIVLPKYLLRPQGVIGELNHD